MVSDKLAMVKDAVLQNLTSSDILSGLVLCIVVMSMVPAKHKPPNINRYYNMQKRLLALSLISN